MMNCPNCGAPIEPYKCKCEYCGTYYYDLTVFDMEENKPCYIKLKTKDGTLTTLAIPRVGELKITHDNSYYDVEASFARPSCVTTLQAEVDVTFTCITGAKNTLFIVD